MLVLVPYKGGVPKTPLPVPETFADGSSRMPMTGNDVTGETQHTLIGQLGWLASKGHPELCEAYRVHASAIRNWSNTWDESLRRVYLWIKNNPLEMHHFIDRRDFVSDTAFKGSGRTDYTIQARYLVLCLFTDANTMKHETQHDDSNAHNDGPARMSVAHVVHVRG